MGQYIREEDWVSLLRQILWKNARIYIENSALQ